MRDRIRVLHVDDEPDLAEVTSTFLAREDERILVETAASGAAGLERLDGSIDCIVSDYEMGEMNGIEFLEAVREEYPDLPFVLFTGRGSEAVASDAISAGVTDYLQKETGTDQYAVLANRITNAVAQVRAQQQAEAERKRFQTLFERLTQPTVEVEYEGGEPLVKQVNPAFEAVFGYGADEIVGNSLDSYIVPADETEEAARINERIRAGDSFDPIEVTRHTRDGTREFLLQNAAYDDGSGGFAIYTDITDRKRREQRLEAQRQQLEDLLDATRTLMSADTREEIAVRASDTARETLDLPVNGIHFYDPERDALVPSVFTDSAEEMFGEPPVIESGGGVAWTAYETGETQVYSDIREAPEVMNEDTPMRSECHIPIGEHGVLIAGSTDIGDFTESDVTSAKILTAQVEAVLDRADRAQRRQERDRLERVVDVVAHDLRSPLTAASKRLELASAECDSPHLAEAADAVERMETLTGDLPAIAREGRQVRETEPTSLEAATEECWSYVGVTGATLQTDTTHTVSADPSRLKQTLENLLGNAVEHNETPVTVTVGDLAEGFYVADDGRGIPADERERMFETGYTAGDSETGLGLSIVREVVDAHGWELGVTESDDGGARFEITGVDLVT